MAVTPAFHVFLVRMEVILACSSAPCVFLVGTNLKRGHMSRFHVRLEQKLIK